MPAREADARVALLNLAEEKYPGLELIRLVSREQIMSSSLFEKFRKEIWDEAAAQGVAEGMTRGIADGMAKGRLGAERELCLERVARDYPELLDAARPVIEVCSDTDKLKDWILTSGAVDAASFARRLGIEN